MIKLELLYHSRTLPHKSDFQRWINAVLRITPTQENALCIVFVDNEASAALNLQYRHKTGPTNVLSFPYKETLGDLVMCVPLIKEEAKQQQKTLRAHFAHLTVHGTLHLLGYDHTHKKDAKIMEDLERKILHQLHFKDPYQ